MQGFDYAIWITRALCINEEVNQAYLAFIINIS